MASRQGRHNSNSSTRARRTEFFQFGRWDVAHVGEDVHVAELHHGKPFAQLYLGRFVFEVVAVLFEPPLPSKHNPQAPKLWWMYGDAIRSVSRTP